MRQKESSLDKVKSVIYIAAAAVIAYVLYAIYNGLKGGANAVSTVVHTAIDATGKAITKVSHAPRDIAIGAAIDAASYFSSNDLTPIYSIATPCINKSIFARVKTSSDQFNYNGVMDLNSDFVSFAPSQKIGVCKKLYRLPDNPTDLFVLVQPKGEKFYYQFLSTEVGYV